jgi:hypothetical protein
LKRYFDFIFYYHKLSGEPNDCAAAVERLLNRSRKISLAKDGWLACLLEAVHESS